MKDLLNNLKNKLFQNKSITTDYRNPDNKELEAYAIENPIKIFLSCFPKSASTYISKTLAANLDYKYVVFSYSAERNEQDLYLPLLEKYSKIPTVTHQHLKASQPNLNLLKKYNIKPIILTRNIFDCLVSIRDHIISENEKWPMAYITRDFFSLSTHTQFDFLIELFLPWYFNFYVSWKDAEKTNKIELLWMTYEEFKRNELDFFNKILTNYGVNYNMDNTKKIHPSQTRFNIGKIGRGQTELTEIQKNKIKDYTSFYPWCDFTDMGL